ncbi:hypothetical protein CTEN210_06726 [Chaetoceros tenuissimus]|uniref:G-protein coupled receptors family 1 profile domain-containing protein n=1 Tax=Chaetoceros tenuissimus TaxID=426638 RepID=A0AAD3CSX2_9STRA|nr:hypothetical protein CTEN210_06726 [Chaetoceros tenuissimus]
MAVQNSENFSIKLWKTLATTQIISASISFLASLLIVASTGKSFLSEKNKHEKTANETRLKMKKTSPYRRIIFLISFSDLFYSLAWITGPFMTQKTNPQALWAVSNSNTACVVNGTLFSFGASTSLLYYAALCYFYYCKISKRMTDEQFTSRYEKKIHAMIAIICIAGSCLSFAASTYNTHPTGTFCANANTPAGCNQQPEIYGECDPTVKTYTPYLAYISILITTYSIVVIIYSMIRLIHSVLKKDKQYGDLPPATPSNPSNQELLHKYNLRKKLLRETMFQAILYTVSWFICQSGTVVGAILHLNGVPNDKFPPALQFYLAAFIPLNSAVNVFIYTRPAVRHVRRIDASISWFRAVYMVLKVGGEAPHMEQSSISTKQQQPQPEKSSREPFGRGEVNEYYGCDPGQGLDSLNVEILGSLEEMSRDNVAYRSEDKWSHNLGGFSDLNMIHEESEESGELDSRFQVSAMSGPSGQNMNTSEFESGLSLSMNTPSTSDIVEESGINVSNVESFEDEGKKEITAHKYDSSTCY